MCETGSKLKKRRKRSIGEKEKKYGGGRGKCEGKIGD
jgi:hypothetical protein